MRCVRSAWARVAWGLAYLAWTTPAPAVGAGSPAPQSAIDVQILCAQWDANSAAAFEARARAELAVRGVSGSLKIQCSAGLQLELRLDGSAPLRAQSASRAPKVEDALELLDELLPTLPADGRTAPSSDHVPTPTTRAPVNPVPADSHPKEPAPANSDPTTQKPAVQPPAASSNAGLPAPNERPSSAPEHRKSSPRRAAPAPSTPSATSNPPVTDGSAARFVTQSAWAAQLSAGAGVWGKSPTLGVTLAGVAALVGRWGLVLEGTGLVTLNTPSSYSTQAAGVALGLRYGLTDAWSLEASAGLGVTRVYTDDEQLRLTLGGPGCTDEARGAQCWGLAGKLGSSWTLTTGQLRPRLGLEVAWTQRPIRITQDADPADAFSLPWIRPSVLIGVEWRDRTTNHANQASSSE